MKPKNESKKPGVAPVALHDLVSFEEGGKEMYEHDLLMFGTAYGYEQDGRKYYIPTDSVFFSNAKSAIQS